MNNKTKATFYIEQELHKYLKILSATSRKSMSSLIEEAIKLLLKAPAVGETKNG